jgi:hypothetical protein
MEQAAAAVAPILIGLLVTSVPTLLWGILLQVNLKLSAQTPWAGILMAAFLVLYWKYLHGWGWPQSLATPRRIGLRAPALAPAQAAGDGGRCHRAG